MSIHEDSTDGADDDRMEWGDALGLLRIVLLAVGLPFLLLGGCILLYFELVGSEFVAWWKGESTK